MKTKTEDAKILIVEDSQTQLMNLKSLLENENYSIITAQNGIEALLLLENELPDAILSDVLMPEMNGYEFCKKIKENKRLRHIPVILLTALADPQDVIKGLNAGADNFIPKPYSNEFLISRIQHLLVNNRMRVGSISNVGIEIFFAGNRHLITSERMQIIDLLLSTYENAVNKNNELIQANMELNRLKEDLEEKNIELQKTNEEKNRLIGIAAHDIRNPLGSIYSFADLLAEEIEHMLDEKQKGFCDIVKSSAEMLLNLVNELLDVSKIEAGELQLKKKKLNFTDFLRRNLIRNKYLAEKKTIRITEDFPDEDILICFDPIRMEQVINNLITNAIKYSNPDTHIDILLQKKSERIKFTIKDHGVGIAENEVDKLFKPFSKTSSTTTAGESSTGLGLFTCKKIVEAHDGSIGVQSTVGSGSSFFFTLPMEVDLPKETERVNVDTAEPKALLKGKKILLVDDIEMNYTYYKGALGKYEIVLDWANDGGQAVDMCKENEYDLILMDIHLPGFSGLEATRRIRKFNQEIIIIGQTAYSMDGMKEKCIQAGCNDYLEMPIRPIEIVKGIIRNF